MQIGGEDFCSDFSFVSNKCVMQRDFILVLKCLQLFLRGIECTNKMVHISWNRSYIK